MFKVRFLTEERRFMNKRMTVKCAQLVCVVAGVGKQQVQCHLLSFDMEISVAHPLHVSLRNYRGHTVLSRARERVSFSFQLKTKRTRWRLTVRYSITAFWLFDEAAA